MLCSNKGTQPIKWMNKDRKLPPRKNLIKRRLPLLQPKPRNQHESQWPQRTCERFQKVAKVRKTRILSIFSRTEFLNGEIGPAANEMRSTTPKSADEWATGLWRQSHPVSTNQKSEIPPSGEVTEWSGGCTDNRRQQHGLQLVFIPAETWYFSF